MRALNEGAFNPQGEYILYWMTACRRPFYNFALQHAAEQAEKRQQPLLIFEALPCDAPFASDRFHQFILEGMADNREHFRTTNVSYYPYAETAPGAETELLTALAKSASMVVTDDHPGTYIARKIQSAAKGTSVRVEAVDSNGLLPLRAAARVFTTAYSFRRFLQKTLAGHLFEFPQNDPLKGKRLPQLQALPEKIVKRWPLITAQLLTAAPQALAPLPIDHRVAPTSESGGWREANLYLQRFLEERLPGYLQRNEPEQQVTSELSPYLRNGHIATHQIVAELFAQENWSIGRLAHEAKGKRSGWWGLSEVAESFLDELVTWREIGFNAAAYLPEYDQYRTLPGWALESLDKHQSDPRPVLYHLERFEQAQTHDPLWNAAQNQLLTEGRIHNYLRMLWGKKILEWSPDAATALQTMLTLNDKYALDGGDPNSVSGVFWCLGRYDRAWGPERPIFGKIRYMTSENTARKFSVKSYLRRYGP
jgi:deoxyribodipyrimidine photo-lyase